MHPVAILFSRISAWGAGVSSVHRGMACLVAGSALMLLILSAAGMGSAVQRALQAMEHAHVLQGEAIRMAQEMSRVEGAATTQALDATAAILPSAQTCPEALSIWMTDILHRARQSGLWVEQLKPSAVNPQALAPDSGPGPRSMALKLLMQGSFGGVQTFVSELRSAPCLIAVTGLHIQSQSGISRAGHRLRVALTLDMGLSADAGLVTPLQQPKLGAVEQATVSGFSDPFDRARLQTSTPATGDQTLHVKNGDGLARPPLERVALRDMSLVGIVEGQGRMVALVKTNEGMFEAAVGSRLGLEGARVTRVDELGIEFEEPSGAGLESSARRRGSLLLRKEMP